MDFGPLPDMACFRGNDAQVHLRLFGVVGFQPSLYIKHTTEAWRDGIGVCRLSDWARHRWFDRRRPHVSIRPSCMRRSSLTRPAKEFRQAPIPSRQAVAIGIDYSKTSDAGSTRRMRGDEKGRHLGLPLLDFFTAKH